MTRFLEFLPGIHIRPTRYHVRIYIIGLSSFVNVIFTKRFVIFYMIRLMDGILPTLTVQAMESESLPNLSTLHGSLITRPFATLKF